MNRLQKEALEEARHELTTLNGLVVADGSSPSETWTIDADRVIRLLDAALSECDDVDRRS